MEGHQPYPRRFKEDEFDVRLKCDAMDEQTFEIARQYTQCAFEADEAISHLIDIVDRCDEDTVVVYFGDHAPTLGANFAGYIASGFAADQKDMLSQEKRLQTYATPFFVYANFDLDENNGMLTPGNGNEIASYNLMNAVFRMIGAPVTERMQFLYDYYQTIPNYNIKLNLPLTDDIEYYKNAHWLLTYDLLCGKRYCLGK